MNYKQTFLLGLHREILVPKPHSVGCFTNRSWLPRQLVSGSFFSHLTRTFLFAFLKTLSDRKPQTAKMIMSLETQKEPIIVITKHRLDEDLLQGELSAFVVGF